MSPSDFTKPPDHYEPQPNTAMRTGPEAGLLNQTEMWLSRGGEPIWLKFADAARLALILTTILRQSRALHRHAAEDERLLASPLLRRAEAEFRVPRVADLTPTVWIESTDLVRWLRRNT